jgi:fibronectin-binding autotransporter adhesin
MITSLSIQRNSVLTTAFALAVFAFSANTASAITENFTTAGTTNWRCPAGVSVVQVECWGGGGAGGGATKATGATGNAGGGGGGGGAYAKLNAVSVTAGNTYTVTIPGAAVSPAANAFTDNQLAPDGALVTFTGDGGITVSANGGKGGGCRVVTGTIAASGAAGLGGVAGMGFDAAFKGGNSVFWSSGNGAGGGGGAGDLAAGGSPSAANASAGAGGTGSDTDHTGGTGGLSRNGSAAGNAPTSPGGGGGGAKCATAGTSFKGANGGLGRIILTYTPVLPVSVKANNELPLNDPASWAVSVPTSAEMALWNDTVMAANTTVIGADLTFGAITIANPGGLVTINAGNILTLGSFATDIDLSSATQDLNLNCALALSDANIWNVMTGRTLTIGGAVSGPFPITKQGTGTTILSGVNSYTGNTTLSAGTLSVSAGSNLGDAASNVVFDGGTLQITGTGMSALGHIAAFSAGKPVILDINDAGNTFTLNQVLNHATGSFTKLGVGSAVLTQTNTYTGATLVSEGALTLSGGFSAGNRSITVSDPSGRSATLNITAGTYPLGSGQINVGNATTAAIGTVFQSGGAISFTSGNGLLVGQNTVANQGIYNMSGGSITTFAATSRGIMLGVNNGTLGGTFNLSGGGELNMTAASGGGGDATLMIGRHDTTAPNTTNVFNQSGGTANVGILSMGGNAAISPGVSSTLTLTGGTFKANQFPRLALGDDNVAVINIGGTADVTLPEFPVARGTNATATLKFDGGTLHPVATSANYISGLTNAYIQDGGAKFDVPTGIEIAIPQAMLEDAGSTGGGLTKEGVGTLTLSGVNSYTGTTIVSQGTLALVGGSSASPIMVNNLASLGFTLGSSTTSTKAVTLAVGSTIKITGTPVAATSYTLLTTSAAIIGTPVLDALITGFKLEVQGGNTLKLVPDTMGGYAGWQTANGTALALDLDHDGDGVPNGVEYFFGGASATTGFTLLPIAINAAATPSVTWTKAASYAGIYATDFVVETSDTLAAGSWTAETLGGSVVITGNDVKYTFPAGVRNFVRLKVSGP